MDLRTQHGLARTGGEDPQAVGEATEEESVVVGPAP